jgi:hypothetical protein
MRKYCLSLLAVSSLAAIVASEFAEAATQLCAGPAVVSGPITNGSTCNLEAIGTTVTELFIGASAADVDNLNLGPSLIFNNQVASGTHANQSVTQGSTLGFNLVNTSDLLNIVLGEPTFNTGTAYTNPANPFPPIVVQPALPGVFHFAWFDMANAADFDSVFGPKVPMTSVANSFILGNGGYSDWIFVGVEDSRVTADDDWNDDIYAFQGVAPVGTGGGGSTIPEASTWLMMLVGFAGLGLAGYRASHKSASLG